MVKSCFFMPFIPEEPQEDNVKIFEKRQIVIWAFLLFLMLASVSFLIYISYQVMRKDSHGSSLSTGDAPILAPISKSITDLINNTDNHYFLFSAYSPKTNKYTLNKMFYNTFAREEVFSLFWQDSSLQPAFAFYRDRIAVFPDINKGYFISQNGKIVVSSTDFIPPDNHFSISPDNKYMFYFAYLSSIGTTSLTLRDIEKGKDIFRWPVSSSASQVCDFVGWSNDNTSVYCLLKNKTSVTLKSFDAISHTVKTIASKNNIVDATYQSKNLLAVTSTSVSLYNFENNEWKNIISAGTDAVFKNALLIPDGSGIIYTQHTNNKTSSEQKVYFVKMDGTEQREIVIGENGNVIAISPDSQLLLFESANVSSEKTRYYFISQINNASNEAVHLNEIPVSGSQFVSWSK